MNTHVVALPPSLSASRDQPCLDFADYLAQRRQVSREEALSVLGETVLFYRPETEALRARRAELGALLAADFASSAA